MEHVIIGVDPHRLSATTEVVEQGHLLGSGRFTTDQSGYNAMRVLREGLAEPGLGGRGCQRRR